LVDVFRLLGVILDLAHKPDDYAIGIDARGQDLGRPLGMGTFKKIRSDLIASRFVEILLQVLSLN
jgi:hypothetical protein